MAPMRSTDLAMLVADRSFIALANAATSAQACRLWRGLIILKPRVADSAGGRLHRRFRPYFRWLPRTSQRPERL